MSLISENIAIAWVGFSAHQKSELDVAFKAAARGAMAYDGSEASEEVAFSALDAFERLSQPILTKGLGHNDKMAAEAALSVWLGRGTKRTYSTDGLMDLMLRRQRQVVRRVVRPQAGQLSALKRLKVKGVLIRPGHYPEGIQDGQGGPPYEIAATAPRFQQLLHLLLTNGVHLDDMLLYEGDAPEGTMRKASYQVLAIPRRNIEIAVCDEVGQATFVATPMLGEYGYTTFEKDMLSALPNVSRIIYNNTVQWEADILARLHGQEVGPKVSIPAYAKRKPNVTEAVINAWIIQHLFESKDHRVPVRNLGAIIGNEHGDTWQSIESAFCNKGRGLEGSHYKTLAHFIQEQAKLGVYDDVLKSLGKTRLESGIQGPVFIEEQVNPWVIKHLLESEKHRVPVICSGAIIGNEHGDTWQSLESAFRYKCRGFENSPYKTLAHFIQEQAKLGVYDEVLESLGKTRLESGIQGPDFTEEQINAWVIRHLRDSQDHRVPGVKSNTIIGNQHGEIWQNVENAFRQKRRGLENSSYNSLHHFIQEQAKLGVFDVTLKNVGKVRFNAGIIGPDFTEAQINTWVIQHLHDCRDHRVPGQKSGLIIGNAHGEVWANIDTSFRHKSRGLEQSQAETLSDFIWQQHQGGIYDDALKELGLTPAEAGIRPYQKQIKSPRKAKGPALA